MAGRSIGIRLALTAWAAACGGGLAALARHQATPGVAAPAGNWPASSRLARATAGDTLLVFVHPKCPCTRATLDNLAVLLAHCPPGRVTVTVLLVRPAGATDGWERTDLAATAAAIPGVTTVVDADGREAAAFGAATSGQAVLFDPTGQLLFRGGLTRGRGHAGASAGADAVLAAVRGERPAATAAPVFGCPLAADSAVATAPIGSTTCRR
jgi:hypothetical protein